MDLSNIITVFGKNTEEYKIIEEAYKLIVEEEPMVASEAKNNMIFLDRSRVKLVTIYYSLCSKISGMRAEIQSSYDTSYTRLVKLGRPSNNAIESEIRATNPNYAGFSKLLEDYENLKRLISDYIRCIDNSKSTTIEMLRDSRRLD